MGANRCGEGGLTGSAPTAPAEPNVRDLRDAVMDAVMRYGEAITQYAVMVGSALHGDSRFSAADADRMDGRRRERFREVQAALAALVDVADQATRD